MSNALRSVIPDAASTAARVPVSAGDIPLARETGSEERERPLTLRETRSVAPPVRPLEVRPMFSTYAAPAVPRPPVRSEPPGEVNASPSPVLVAPTGLSLGEVPRARVPTETPPATSISVSSLDVVPPTPGKQTLLGDEIRRVPGTAGDTLRAIEILPSVKGGGDLSGMLFIRGGGPEDNRFYFDRMPIRYPYHFGGLTSTLSSELIGKVDVHAGGFGAEYGNAQAVIDIASRSGENDFALVSNTNLLLSEWYVRSPLSERGSFYLAGRRTYADLIVPKVIRLEQVTAFPRFWDYQAGLRYDLSNRHQLRFHAVGSDDLMRFVLKAEDVSNKLKYAGEAEWSNGFHGQGVTLDSRWGERLSVTSHLSRLESLTHLHFGQGFYLDIRPVFWTWREDIRASVHDRHTLEVGTEIVSQPVRFSANFFRLPSEENTTGTFDGVNDDPVRSKSNKRFLYANTYIQDRISLGEKMTLSVGGRAIHFNLARETRFDPRLSLMWEPNEGTKIRAAWGIYSQSPEPRQIDADFGNPDLKSFTARHRVLEIERSLSDAINIQTAFYRKDLWDLVTEDPQKVFKNQGRGFAQGVETLVRFAPSERFLGWLSYTYSVSKRRYRPFAPEVFDPYDQTHVATLLASYRPNPHWELGAKWQYLTGRPFTPVIGSYPTYRSDGTFRDFKPIYGEPNSERYPPYHRLDLRAARTFSLANGEMQVYLEVLNAYSRKNVLSPQYNDDYSERTWVYQLPMVPFFGLSFRF